MCDVVYALLVQRIESDVMAMQQACLTAAMFGGDPPWPDLDERIAELDTFLASKPKKVDSMEADLREALGLRRK